MDRLNLRVLPLGEVASYSTSRWYPILPLLSKTRSRVLLQETLTSPLRPTATSSGQVCVLENLDQDIKISLSQSNTNYTKQYQVRQLSESRV